MITFVYCCICLLIVCCQTTRTESEEYGYNNDSPDTLDTLPEVIHLRYKSGAPVSMRCNKHHPNKENITWEFMQCKKENEGEGIFCDKKNIYKLNYGDGEWRRLQHGKRKKLEIKNATENNIGYYRCLYNDSIIKIFFLDFPGLMGPSPKILSLIPSSNSPITANTPLTIQCKATSTKPAEIRWFKECKGLKCDWVHYDRCVCQIPVSSLNSVYSKSNKMCLSKLNIYKSRSVDSGIYYCVAINQWGEDHKNITIKVDDMNHLEDEDRRNSFSLLFLIPLILILVPVSIWLCFNKRKRKSRRHLNDHQKQLIKPVVEVDIALNADDVI